MQLVVVHTHTHTHTHTCAYLPLQDYTRSDYSPECGTANLFPGTFYLDRVDSLERRFYQRHRGLHTAAAAATPAVHTCAPRVQACASQRVLLRSVSLLRRALRR